VVENTIMFEELCGCHVYERFRPIKIILCFRTSSILKNTRKLFLIILIGA